MCALRAFSPWARPCWCWPGARVWSLHSPQDLRGAQVTKIGHPDAKAAIYGRAAVAFLKGSGLMPTVKDKVAMFSTVPQVFSYLVSGDLDAGFVNRGHCTQTRPKDRRLDGDPQGL